MSWPNGLLFLQHLVSLLLCSIRSVLEIGRGNQLLILRLLPNKLWIWTCKVTWQIERKWVWEYPDIGVVDVCIPSMLLLLR